jgi:hypothetical protein
MKNTFTKIALGIALLFASQLGKSQTTAMDFNRLDCNGNMQHLFADLDAGNAVILEFFMQNCNPCIVAAGKLEAMKADLLAEFPGKIKGYAIGFNNSYSCASNINWVTTNNVTSIPMDSGATQVAYYGGMGMPTIVILGGGTNHAVLGSPYVGFATSDTITMAADIRNFLNTTTGISTIALTANTFEVYPNPANGLLNFRCNFSAQADLSLQIMDLTGKTLLTVNEKNIAAGEFTLSLNTAELAAGTYLIKATVNDAVLTKRFTVNH